MNNVNIFLTLFGFGYGNYPFNTPMSTDNILVPAHQAIYGGYTMYAGALFEKNDFYDTADNFARKMAIQFMFGAQMGWFGMGRYGNAVSLPASSGPPIYGIYNELMNQQFDPEIQYLRKLSQAKKIANPYFLHGRMQRTLPLQKHIPNDTVFAFAWLDKDASKLLIPISVVRKSTGNYMYKSEFDISRYGIDSQNGKLTYNVNQLSAYDGQSAKVLGQFPGNKI